MVGSGVGFGGAPFFAMLTFRLSRPGEGIMAPPKTTSAGLAVCLGLTFLSNLTIASEYCTKQQYERDRALIENATSTGMLVKGPKMLRDSILVKEDEWFKMDYPQQIGFMQSFECAMAGVGGKHLLYMDVRSRATGKLLATWSLGVLNPTP